VIRMQNGRLAFCSDAQHRDGDRPRVDYNRGAIVAVSENDGDSWHIKNLAVTLPHEEDDNDGTLGYSSIRQAPNGVLHILSTMTHPCLHYELNEAWIFSGEGDIPPETTGGTVKDYTEYYPSGALRAKWSARICTNGRYLLQGKETFYYEDGGRQYVCHYENGRKRGTETFWTPNGIRLWEWQHQSKDSKWAHYWPNGFERIASLWETDPHREGRLYTGFRAEGPTYHWDRRGVATHAWSFNNGRNEGSTSLPPNQTRPKTDPATFVRHWLWQGISGEPGYNQADLNFDGAVNFADFAVFAAQQ